MNKYTLLNLSPDEFELLSRDLLQDLLTIQLESFKAGKDNGIDFRGWNNDDCIIVQCKRFTLYKDLLGELRKEVVKVAQLNPSRYILTTSVPLNPTQKNHIAGMFSPWLHVRDIYALDDLNNLIGQNPTVERRHYKLWLSSTNVLQSIINNRAYIQSQKEQEHLDRISRIYVMNDSYEKALSLLKDNRFVILSGNPGVGKTTLARVLAYEFIKSGFKLIVATSTVKEVFDLYSDAEDQVIFFDDFLGRNILEGRYPINEEHQLTNLIDIVSRSKNKVLILTTREYILNQAKQKYELIKTANLDISKCIVDVSTYTKYIKAKILYNHLFFAGLPIDYLTQIVQSRVYINIIEHANYNPRIIEAIVKKKDWDAVPREQLQSILLDYLNKPYSIWETAYEREINDLSKLLLPLMVSTGTPILKEDLYKALSLLIAKFPSKYNVTLNDFEYTDSLRELHDTFIVSTMDSFGNVSLDFQNPSIQDFLVNYLSDKHEMQEHIISSAAFYNQLFEVFATPKKIAEDSGFYTPKLLITISDRLKAIFVGKLISDLHILGNSRIHRTLHQGGKFGWRKDSLGVYDKLRRIIDVHLHDGPEIMHLIESEFAKVVVPKDIHGHYRSYINVMEVCIDTINISFKVIAKSFIKDIYWAQDLSMFAEFNSLFPEEYDEFVSNDADFKVKVKEVVKNEFKSADESNYSEIIYEINELVDEFSVNAAFELAELERLHTENEERINTNIDSMDFDLPDMDSPEISNEYDAIDYLFKSLIA